MVCACGEGHKLIAVLRHDSRIVFRQGLDALDVFVEIRLGGHPGILIILEFRRILGIYLAMSRGDDSISSLSALIYRIEPECLMLIV